MKKLHTLAVIATFAAAAALPAVGFQRGATVAVDEPIVVRPGAPYQVSGTISSLDRQHGLVTVASPYGPLKLHFPSQTLGDLRTGDQITAQYTVLKIDRIGTYDTPLASDGMIDLARGETGGVGTTHDRAAGGQSYDASATDMTGRSEPIDLARGSTGGIGTTQDQTAAGERFATGTTDVIAPAPPQDLARGATGGAGTTQDETAAGQDSSRSYFAADAPIPGFVATESIGGHLTRGQIMDLDKEKGTLKVKTSETTLQLRLPPTAMVGLEKGDFVSVQLDLMRGA